MHAQPSSPNVTPPQPIVPSEELRCEQCNDPMPPRGDLQVTASLCADCAFQLPCTD